MLTTFVALMMPVLIVIFAAVLNISHVVDAKIKLQNAADRAAYAGAAMQAHIMDEMGKQNNEVHDAFEWLTEQLVPNTSNGEGDVQGKFITAKNRIDTARAIMDGLNSQAWQKASDISTAVALANYAAADLKPRVPSGAMLTILDNLEEDQHQHLRSDWNNNIGGVIWEPASHEHFERVIQSYYVKDALLEVRWQVGLEALIPSGFMSFAFKPVLRNLGVDRLQAVAAAQPHGASIKACAFDENCAKYQVSFVP